MEMLTPQTKNRHQKKQINSWTGKNPVWMQLDVSEVNGEGEKAWDGSTGQIAKGLKLCGQAFGAWNLGFTAHPAPVGSLEGTGVECGDKGFHKEYPGSSQESVGWKGQGLCCEQDNLL